MTTEALAEKVARTTLFAVADERTCLELVAVVVLGTATLVLVVEVYGSVTFFSSRTGDAAFKGCY